MSIELEEIYSTGKLNDFWLLIIVDNNKSQVLSLFNSLPFVPPVITNVSSEI